MSEFLDTIVSAKRDELAERIRARPPEALRDMESPALRDFRGALELPGISAIAEIKRKSPSLGWLRADLDPVLLAGDYEASGGRAISVLTDRPFFAGSDDDLVAARRATQLPVLRKDFTIDPYQLLEARVLGADAVLLIVRILGDGQLSELSELTRELGMAALVEVHDEADLERAVGAGAEIIGINSRNLASFETCLDGAAALMRSVPEGRLVVAESGIGDRADVVRMENCGFDAFLVGSALVRADSPGEQLAGMLGDTP